MGPLGYNNNSIHGLTDISSSLEVNYCSFQFSTVLGSSISHFSSVLAYRAFFRSYRESQEHLVPICTDKSQRRHVVHDIGMVKRRKTGFQTDFLFLLFADSCFYFSFSDTQPTSFEILPSMKVLFHGSILYFSCCESRFFR